MLWIGHLALGYLATKLFLVNSLLTLSTSEINILILLGMLAALLPDLDLIPFFLKHRSMKLQKNKSHRRIWSHAPLLWAFILIIGAFFTTSTFAFFICLAILIGSWSHFIGDSIEYGVYWLWPFSSQKFYLHKARGTEPLEKETSVTHYYTTFIKKVYIKNWTFYIEILIIIAALALFLS